MTWLTLRIPPALVWVISCAAMWLIANLTPSLSPNFDVNIAIPLLIAIIGVGLILYSSSMLLHFRTTLNPMKPEGTSTLIKTGPFRFSRNPIYLGFAMLLLGWGIFLNNILALTLVAGFVYYINCFQIKPEEKLLSQKFGNEFEIYKSHVRRWL